MLQRLQLSQEKENHSHPKNNTLRGSRKREAPQHSRARMGLSQRGRALTVTALGKSTREVKQDFAKSLKSPESPGRREVWGGPGGVEVPLDAGTGKCERKGWPNSRAGTHGMEMGGCSHHESETPQQTPLAQQVPFPGKVL